VCVGWGVLDCNDGWGDFSKKLYGVALFFIINQVENICTVAVSK